MWDKNEEKEGKTDRKRHQGKNKRKRLEKRKKEISN